MKKDSTKQDCFRLSKRECRKHKLNLRVIKGYCAWEITELVLQECQPQRRDNLCLGQKTPYFAEHWKNNLNTDTKAGDQQSGVFSEKRKVITELNTGGVTDERVKMAAPPAGGAWLRI